MNSFRLKNIKGFVDTGELELKPITIMIGENSSGKSSIVRFPLVLRQTFQDASMAPLLFFGKSIDYGNFEDVVFNHDKSKSIEFELSIDSINLLRAIPFFTNKIKRELNNDELNVRVCITYLNRTLKVNNISVKSGNKHLISVEQCSKDEYKIVFNENTILNIPKDQLTFEKFLPDFRLLRIRDKNDEWEERYEYAYNIFNSLNYYFNNFANNIFYIGPFRQTPERFYRYTENSVNYVGRDGEFASVILGQNLRGDQELVHRVSAWLEDNLQFSLNVEDLKGDLFKLVIRDLKTNAKNNIIDVGHGLSQLLPILVQTFMKSESEFRPRIYRRRLHDLIIIEQPELHLHPSAQATLADLFVESIKQNSRKHNPKQFLIETHSEHMILRLRRYIAENKISHNDIALYYSEKDTDTESLKVRKLAISQDGEITDWPDGFFSQDYYEIKAIHQALSKKNSGGKKSSW